jgi:hypothetical protein
MDCLPVLKAGYACACLQPILWRLSGRVSQAIELRRRDTTTWVRKIQLAVLEILAHANNPDELGGTSQKEIENRSCPSGGLDHSPEVEPHTGWIQIPFTRCVRGLAIAGKWPANHSWSVGAIPVYTRGFRSPSLGTWRNSGTRKVGYKTILHIIGSGYTDCA